ncbi:putative reverse transcriptase domain-containing protein [Tanacetum coccineum]
MSSPSYPTSDIDDAFSSNFLKYIPASPDYVPASPRKTYSSSSNKSFGLVPIASPTLSLFHVDPYMKVMHAYYAKESPIPLPTNEQIEEILNHLDELSLSHIKNIEEKIEGLGKGRMIIKQDFDNLEAELREMPPKRTSTSKAPAMTQAAIRKLVADSVIAALEAQAATRANADNTNRNTGEREAHVARQCSYKELMSCQPINFKDSEKMIEVFIGGLPRSIEGNVTASKPQTLEEAINIAQRLMDQETFRSYAVTPTENNGYTRNRPLCKKCTLHHIGPCTVKCNTCNKVGHLTKNCRNKGPATGSNLLPVTVTCHACGEKGHYANQCRKTTNNNAQGRAYMLRDRNAHQDPNVVTGMFLLNQHLARVLFDSGADKSFVSISLASMLNIPPITIDTFYDIEMADGNLVSTNTIIQGCTLTMLNQPFEIDLMPIKLGRIICDEKVVHIPIKGETLIIRVMEKKSDEKRLEDIPVVREFPKVFPEDLPGLPPVRQVEFQIDLILGATPVARAPHRLAPSEMQELSNQLQEFIRSSVFIRASIFALGSSLLCFKK